MNNTRRILPKVLVVDDQYGHPGKEDNFEMRQNFCYRTGLKDVTGDCEPRVIEKPVAEAEFISGQMIVNECVENDIEGTLDYIRGGWEKWPRWSLLLLDMHFKTGNLETKPEGRDEDRSPENYFGLMILKSLYADESLRDIPVVILSSMDRKAIEETMSEHGALDFNDKQDLKPAILFKILNEIGIIEDDNIEDDKIIARSIPMLKCLREARKQSKLGKENILILGETGTGKELLAKYIHKNAKKTGRTGKYVKLFVRSTAADLVDDRLFGHGKEAYSGSRTDKPGVIEEAVGGTLFIDEFGNIPANIQDKFLRFLDTSLRESQRQGAGSKVLENLDVLVVMATNRVDIINNPQGFMGDLLERVKSGAIIIPPLRERKEDIPLLTEHFMRHFEQKLSAQKREIKPDAMSILMDYDWPGNVRELGEVIKGAIRGREGLRVITNNHIIFEARTTSISKSEVVSTPDESENDTPSTQDEAALVTDEQSNAEADVAETVVVSEAEKSGVTAGSLKELIDVINKFPIEKLEPESIVGTLCDLQDAFRNFLAAYVKSALMANRRGITKENKIGEPKIHPAMRLITGNQELTGSQAADLVKRLRIFGQDGDIWEQDDILKAAYGKSKSLRPSYTKEEKEERAQKKKNTDPQKEKGKTAPENKENNNNPT